MIIPGYSPTATERILPALSLDFTTAVLDARVTVTRALNTATAINSSGYISTVNANLPRFDYSPVTLVCRGLLIEETRANVIVFSDQLDTASWGKTNVTVSANNTTSPDGTLNADKVVESAIAGFHSISQSKGTNGVSETLSLYAKAAGRSWIAIQQGTRVSYFNVASGTLGSIGSGVTAAITDAGNGWYRCTVTSTRDTTANVVLLASANNTASYTGDGVSGVYIWGVDNQTGSFPTSYIPTTTVSVTRNSDVVVMTGTNFNSWYTSSSAALAAVVTPNIAVGTCPIWQLDDTTANEIIALRGNAANPELYIVDNGTPQAQLDAGTITANTQYGLCAAFTANSCAASQNGAAPVTTATATMPTVTQARIGSDGSNFLNGAVRTLRYWPQRILNAETQAFSKL